MGTLFVDVNLKNVEKIFRMVRFGGDEKLYVINESGDCFFSNDETQIMQNMQGMIASLQDTRSQIVLKTAPNEYGLSIIVVMDTKEAFRNIEQTQRMMYVFLALSALLLLFGSLFFSKKLTNPIHEMMYQMEELENGNFDIQLQVRTEDEIGILAERFNQMSTALNTYINQVYVSKIRQNEAELTALKSQIYPHFLYNTLEIIRMTALEDEESKVPEMIEALSEQIHYLIGPMQDMVTLEKEIDIVQKYVYLLNCRIAGKVQLMINASGDSQILVPRLILQPIVENAYVHGIKPKKGSGSIMIESLVKEEVLEISVMDNGVGMDEEALLKIHNLLNGDEPGVKNEYNWQSIGLKNVHDRIRYLYGEPYGIEITSTKGVGTMTRIVMPLKKVTDEQDKE